MNHLLILRLKILLFIFSLISQCVYTQVIFDVKTTMEEKAGLHIIKIAVINTIVHSDWALVQDVGENYSLWLTNFKRSKTEQSIISELDIALRTPAMLSRGKFIDARHILVQFDTSGVSNARSPTDTLVNKLLLEGIQSSGLLTISIPYLDLLLIPFATSVLNEINRQPTPMESVEANLLSTAVLVELEKIFSIN